MSFPPRTPWSDMKAEEVSKALARASKGQNFMVTCVDTGALTYVALSGEPSSALLTALQEQLALSNILLSAMPSANELKKRRSNAQKEDNNAALNAAKKGQIQQKALKRATKRASTYVVVADSYSFNGSMMDPDRAQVEGRAKEYEKGGSDNPLTFGGNRNCSEPKALEAVGRAGLKPLGMTTIWYGSRENPYPHPKGLPSANPALPCDFCEMNAQRVMIHAFR